MFRHRFGGRNSESEACRQTVAAVLERGTVWSGLTPDEQNELSAAVVRIRQFRAREDLLRESEPTDVVHLVVDGFACRYKMLDNGGRSIVAFLLPGELCNHPAAPGHLDHSVATLTGSAVAEIPLDMMQQLAMRSRSIAHTIHALALAEQAVLREWLVNMGRRPADRQLAHLLCELLVRLQQTGHAQSDRFELPLTQEELGDALGISTVHVNRVLQQLREQGLITLRGKALIIPDLLLLSRFAGFRPTYLTGVATPHR